MRFLTREVACVSALAVAASCAGVDAPTSPISVQAEPIAASASLQSGSGEYWTSTEFTGTISLPTGTYTRRPRTTPSGSAEPAGMMVLTQRSFDCLASRCEAGWVFESGSPSFGSIVQDPT